MLYEVITVHCQPREPNGMSDRCCITAIEHPSRKSNLTHRSARFTLSTAYLETFKNLRETTGLFFRLLFLVRVGGILRCTALRGNFFFV